MDARLQAQELAELTWLEIELILLAHGEPRRSHPLIVLEALLKGVFEAAGLDARQVKQLWHSPGQRAWNMGWQAGDRIPVTVQLFGLPAQALPMWQERLADRLAPPARHNFTLERLLPWRNAHPPPAPAAAATLTLDFLTPVPLPHAPGRPRTALDASGFLRLCQTRLRKLFGREGALPPPPELDTTGWRYWRIEHRSRSQNGHPMFINGCIGPLILAGEDLAAWLPWLALFSAVGVGERLSFGQGRFEFAGPAREEIGPAPAPLRLRRPFVLDSDEAGAQLGLADANLVVSHGSLPERKLPLARIEHIVLHGPCQVSTPLIAVCAQEGIPLMISAPGQTPIVIVGQRAEAERNRRLAAHHAAWDRLDAAQRARVGARLADQKLANCAWLVRQRYRPGDYRLLEQIERARQALARTERLAVVRGWEGWAARHYYRWLHRQCQSLGESGAQDMAATATDCPDQPARQPSSGAMRDAKAWVRRHHGQGGDEINCLLNYGYGLLRRQLACGIRLAGLDPWLGILHEANGRHEALVSDLMEPWRPHIDRLVLRWIGLKIIRPDSFVWVDGQLRLTPEARLRMVQDFTRMLESPPRNGGPRLATRMRTLLDSYAAAAARGALAEWSPPESTASALAADDEA